MIEFTAFQFTLLCALVTVCAWVFRLEGKVNIERELRKQSEINSKEKDFMNNGRITNFEGRIFDDIRKLNEAILRLESKYDRKQDKAENYKD